MGGLRVSQFLNLSDGVLNFYDQVHFWQIFCQKTTCLNSLKQTDGRVIGGMPLGSQTDDRATRGMPSGFNFACVLI